MPKSRPPYPAEFRARMVELVRSGRTPEELSREFYADRSRAWLQSTTREIALAASPSEWNTGISASARAAWVARNSLIPSTSSGGRSASRTGLPLDSLTSSMEAINGSRNAAEEKRPKPQRLMG